MKSNVYLNMKITVLSIIILFIIYLLINFVLGNDFKPFFSQSSNSNKIVLETAQDLIILSPNQPNPTEIGLIDHIKFDPNTQNVIVTLKQLYGSTTPSSSLAQETVVAISKPVYYSVQILSSKNNNPKALELGGWRKYVSIHKDKRLYRYTIGEYHSYGQALSSQTQLSDDFPQCFIVAFQNEKPISLAIAKKLLRK